MKKKNLLLFGAAAMLSLALAGPLGAANTVSAETLNQGSGGKTAETTVSYTVEDTWTVEIPESITISGKTGTADVKASDVVIEQGTNLKVTVSSGNEWKLTDGTNNFNYELKVAGNGTALDNDSNNTVLTVAAGAEGEQTANLTATVTDANAGKYSTGGDAYTDTLTFTVTVG